MAVSSQLLNFQNNLSFSPHVSQVRLAEVRNQQQKERERYLMEGEGEGGVVGRDGA